MKYEDIARQLKKPTPTMRSFGELLSSGKGQRSHVRVRTSPFCGPLRPRNTPESWLD